MKKYTKKVSEISKEEMNLLRDILDMFYWIGLGKIFGYLGRNQAILHHEILHDDPRCRAIDKKGNFKKCTLNKHELSVMCELCNNEADILAYKKKNFYKKLSKFIEDHKTKENFDEAYERKLPKADPEHRPNWDMLPSLPKEPFPVISGFVVKGETKRGAK